MQELSDLVERIEPNPKELGDWDAVVKAARRERTPVFRRSLIGVTAAAAVLSALALFQPWGGESQTLLERAQAAVGDGPVLHVVLRGEWGGTNVDLETGERRPVHGENEIWYDPARQLIHQISRLGERVQGESVYDPGRAPAELLALGRNYQAALRSGSARIAGEDVIDGERVTWIIVHSELLPDTDGKRHVWAQQVAISNETFKPVATRDTRDGHAPPGTLQRVLELATLPAGQGDFAASGDPTMEGPFQQGRSPIAVDRAAGVLGRAPLWLGREHAGLPLAQVSETFLRKGRQEATRLTGRAADEARACRNEFRRTGLEGSATCDRMRARRRGFRIQGDTVFELGPVVWGEKQVGVSFFYGTLGDDPSTYRQDLVPLGDRPNVTITQSTDASALWPRAMYIPPDGLVFIGAGARSGTVQVNGLIVAIQASSEELILSAARALKPMP
jgi:hypothetical protein